MQVKYLQASQPTCCDDGDLAHCILSTWVFLEGQITGAEFTWLCNISLG